MRRPRIFINQPLHQGHTLELQQEPLRHLVQVLRLKAGDALILFNGDGHDYPAQLVQADRRKGQVAIMEPGAAEPQSALSIQLGLSISKGERMDFAIQKAVELGVDCITPLMTERSVVRLSSERSQRRLDHWRRVAISACEQSGRRRIPELSQIQFLSEWLQIKTTNLKLILDPEADEGLQQISPPNEPVQLLVGPEGGFSQNEITHARDSGFRGIRLGPRILRTETAPLAAIAAMQTLWGDLGH